MEPEIFILILALLAAAAIGLCFRYFAPSRRALRAIRRTRPQTIGSFPEGARGRVSGRLVAGDETVTAPLSGRPCSCYHLKLTESGGESRRSILDESKGRDLYVEDETGRALVHMTAATAHITKDHHVGTGFLAAATPAIERFMKDRGLDVKTWIGTNRSLQFQEGVLEEGERITVIGRGRWEDTPDGRLLTLGRDGPEPVLITDDVETVRGTTSVLRRQRRARGLCVDCGYDLRGARGCPECGRNR